MAADVGSSGAVATDSNEDVATRQAISSIVQYLNQHQQTGADEGEAPGTARDVNTDGVVSPMDVLVLVNRLSHDNQNSHSCGRDIHDIVDHLNHQGPGPLPATEAPQFSQLSELDVNVDFFITAQDVLTMINARDRCSLPRIDSLLADDEFEAAPLVDDLLDLGGGMLE